MIHASRELVDAMGGREPAFDSSTEGAMDTMSACGGRHQDGPSAWASLSWPKNGAAEDYSVVDCPACLLLMRAATCPARWDHLETLGLAPKLEAK